MRFTAHTRRRSVALLLALTLLLAGCTDPYGTEELGEQTGSDAQTETATEQEEQTDGETEETQAEEKTAQQSFTLGYYSDLGLNPYTCNNTTNQSLARLLYEPLFQQSPTFETETCLAQSCTSDGGTRWTLTLELDVTFWDGTALDAGDVVASLQAAAQEGSLYADRLAPMDDLEQTGEYTLTFTWSEPLGDLTPLLEIPIVQAGTETDDLPVGTGPYQLQLDEQGQAEMLTAFSGWWQGAQLPAEQIELYAVTDSEMLIYGFESGAITLVSTDFTASDSLGYSGSYEVWDYPTSYLLYLGCNTASGICQEQEFRLALQSALDRETIAQSLLSGHADPSPLTFHPSSPLYDEALAQQLSQADASDLQAYAGETVSILVNTESTFRTAVAAFLAESLENAGLEAEVSALPWSDYLQALEEGSYDLYLGQVKLEPDFDLTALLTSGGSLNFTGQTDGALTDALADYLASSGESRVERAYALSLALSQTAPILPLCFIRHSMLSNWGSLERYAATQANLFYRIQDWNLGTEEKEGRTAQ